MGMSAIDESLNQSILFSVAQLDDSVANGPVDL